VRRRGDGSAVSKIKGRVVEKREGRGRERERERCVD
jgi:hypothetical protein